MKDRQKIRKLYVHERFLAYARNDVPHHCEDVMEGYCDVGRGNPTRPDPSRKKEVKQKISKLLYPTARVVQKAVIQFMRRCIPSRE